MTKQNIKCISVCIAALVIFGALIGCASNRSMDMMSEGSLAPWKGEWRSFDAVSQASKLKDAYDQATKSMNNYTVDGFKAAAAAMYTTPFSKIKFNGSNTVKFTVMESDGTEKEISCEYKYEGKVPMAGYDGYFWETYKAVKPVRGLSKAQYFIATSPHQHGEDGLNHWHGRFGANSIEALVNADSLWWPTYVAADMTDEKLTEEFAKSIPSFAGMLPVSPFEKYTGKWINTSLIYENTSEAVQNVYKKLIAEFAGKNPKGGDFTKDDIIAVMKGAYGTTDDFTELEFISADGKNEMIVYKDGKKVRQMAYRRDGALAGKESLTAFSATDTKAADRFACFVCTGVHGTPKHFHLWYGADADAVKNIKGVPTCIPSDTSDADIALRVEKTCRKVLKDMIN